jgi:hypothetical protein
MRTASTLPSGDRSKPSHSFSFFNRPASNRDTLLRAGSVVNEDLQMSVTPGTVPHLFRVAVLQYACRHRKKQPKEAEEDKSERITSSGSPRVLLNAT